MRRYLLPILFLIITTAQAQKTLSLEDAVLGAGSYLKPQMPGQLQWKNNETYVFVLDSFLFESNIKDNQKKQILTLGELNKKLKASGTASVRRFPDFTALNNDTIWFLTAQQLVLFSLNDLSVVSHVDFENGAVNQDYCPANNKLAYTIGNNLFVAGVSGKEQITNDKNIYIVNGQSVHRNEFGIKKGTFWSPTGNYLAFYRMDETMVGDYPLVDFMAREATLNNVKYPMAGMTSHQVKLTIYNMATKKTVFLKTGEPADHYLTNISWSPDEEQIYIAELNREQNHMRLNCYDAATGEFVKTVLEETSPKYVEPQNPIVFSNVDPTKFYLQTRRDGWNHVYLYDTSGKLIRQVTSGKWEVTQVLGFDAKEQNMFFEATKESPIERHLYRISLKDGKIEKLSGEAGTHAGVLSPDQQFVLDRWTSTGVPGKLELITVKKIQRKTVFEAENTLNNYELGENTVFSIKAADDSTNLYCRMIKPTHFDPAKKYPVIVYVYGGPHDQLVNKTWLNDARWWQYYMASKGYIAFTVDGRGSDNRGAAFENVIHRNLGVAETADQMKGIEYLKSLPYVDNNRIGVHGWSYGGFMTLNLMLKHPDTFKVGVSGGPVVDWKMYEVMYGERYMDTPQENPEGYENANMMNYIDRLQGKLMIIHGVQDQTVVMQHSIQFLKRCIDKGKQLDFFVYPTHEHNVRGKDRVHLMEKVSNYFLENL